MILAAAALWCGPAVAAAADILVADRLTNAVYRYSAAGELLNVVLIGSDGGSPLINQPTGLALSADATQLYVSSSQTNSVIRYAYDAATGTASQPIVFASQEDGLSFPNAILLSPAGDAVYVANLGGSGIARFRLDGSSAGPALPPFGGGAFDQLSGLAWTPTGELLVGGFIDSTTGSTGAVAKSDATVETLDAFVDPSASLLGASGVMVHDGFAYVAAMFAGNVQRFRLADGLRDASFNVTGLAFPQGLLAAPEGDGLLVGVLGIANGAGRIARYDFDGSLLGDGIFAEAGHGGFSEATALVAVPALAGVPGDFNGDRAVDMQDLAIWSTHFGDSSGSATLTMGDADGNGRVDGADLLVWQRSVGSSGRAATTAVPEPTSMSWVALTTVSCAGPRRRRTAEVAR